MEHVQLPTVPTLFKTSVNVDRQTSFAKERRKAKQESAASHSTQPWEEFTIIMLPGSLWHHMMTKEWKPLEYTRISTSTFDSVSHLPEVHSNLDETSGIISDVLDEDELKGCIGNRGSSDGFLMSLAEHDDNSSFSTKIDQPRESEFNNSCEDSSLPRLHLMQCGNDDTGLLELTCTRFCSYSQWMKFTPLFPGANSCVDNYLIEVVLGRDQLYFSTSTHICYYRVVSPHWSHFLSKRTCADQEQRCWKWFSKHPMHTKHAVACMIKSSNRIQRYKLLTVSHTPKTFYVGLLYPISVSSCRDHCLL